MAIRELAMFSWKNYFDAITDAVQGKLVHIEVDSLELGAQTEVDKLSLNGLTFDERDQSLIISTDEIEHTIRAPQQIYVTEGLDGLTSVKVTSENDITEIISLSVPLALPPAD